MTAIAREDRNIFAAGLALDALNRLGRLHRDDRCNVAAQHLDALLAELPAHCWEPLLRGGLPRERALVHAG